MLPAKTRAGALSGLVLIGLVAWFAHFSLSSQFLFYEDDYAKVVDAMARNFEESAYNFYCHCRDWPQGRPLGFGLIAPFSYVGVKMGGLQGVYITGYLMLLANTGLFFLLTRKFAGTNAAIFGAPGFLPVSRRYRQKLGHPFYGKRASHLFYAHGLFALPEPVPVVVLSSYIHSGHDL